MSNNFNYEEVQGLLDEMEACVERVKTLRKDFENKVNTDVKKTSENLLINLATIEYGPLVREEIIGEIIYNKLSKMSIDEIKNHNIVLSFVFIPA